VSSIPKTGVLPLVDELQQVGPLLDIGSAIFWLCFRCKIDSLGGDTHIMHNLNNIAKGRGSEKDIFECGGGDKASSVAVPGGH